MSDSITEDVLAHYGIEVGTEIKHYGRKGMKWGVRRERGPDGRVRGKVVSEDYESSRKTGSKKQSQLSNAELKRVNERLQLERTNRELQYRGVLQKIKTGTALAGTILAVGATVNTAIQFANSPAGKAIKNAINKNPANPDWLF